MPSVMPTQVVQTIDELFPHAKGGVGTRSIGPGDSSQLLGVVTLVKAVPAELITVSSNRYADLVLAVSTIEAHLQIWTFRNPAGHMAAVKGVDAITVIRRVLADCPDEYPASSTMELLFINDVALRDSICRDTGAASRALNNAEWKAATVLAGSAIEALLLWAVQQPPMQPKLPAAVAAVVQRGILRQDRSTDPEHWNMAQFIAVAAELRLIRPNTKSAALLAKDFRNLIHPGLETRLGQSCNRATALTAVAALEHIVTDLTP